MKIALVIPHFAAEGAGGPGRNAADLARGLAERGHEVHILAHRFESDDARLRWHPVPIIGLRLLRPWSFARNALAVQRRESFDIVHAFTRVFECDVCFVGGGVHREYLARVNWNRPLARAFASINPKHWMANWVEARGYRGSCRIFAVLAERTREEILRHYAVAPERIRLVRIGIDTRRFSPDSRRRLRTEARKELGLDPGQLAAAFVGSGWKIKGLGFAIQGIAAAPRWTLLVCGKGPARAYQRLARRVGCPVRFLGPRKDVERVLAAADALVHPSLHDPFPNAVLEAMASGLPTAMTRVTGTSELVTPGKDAFVLEHGSDVRGLAGALHRLEDSELRESMGLAARAAAEPFTIDRYVEEYLKLYREILQSR